MSDVTTNPGVVNSGVPEQVEKAVQLSAEQQADIMAEAKKELGLVSRPCGAGTGRTSSPSTSRASTA